MYYIRLKLETDKFKNSNEIRKTAKNHIESNRILKRITEDKNYNSRIKINIYQIHILNVKKITLRLEKLRKNGI